MYEESYSTKPVTKTKHDQHLISTYPHSRETGAEGRQERVRESQACNSTALAEAIVIVAAAMALAEAITNAALATTVQQRNSNACIVLTSPPLCGHLDPEEPKP